MHQFRTLLAEGYIGQLARVHLQLHFPSWPRQWQGYRKTDWISQREQGGALREIGSHFFFAILELFGGVKSVNAEVQFPTIPDPDFPHLQLAELGVLGRMELQSGVPVQVDVLCNVASIPESIELRAIGTTGVISLSNFQNLLVSKEARPLTLHPDAQVISAQQLMSSDPIVDALSHAIRQAPKEPASWKLVSVETAEKTHRIVQALLDSHSHTIHM
jgi:predicted dehydrogenase